MLSTHEDSADEQSVNTLPREGSATEEGSVGTLPNEDQDHGFTEEVSIRNKDSREELNVSFAESVRSKEKSDSREHSSSFNTGGDPRFRSTEVAVPCLHAREHKTTSHNGDVLGTLSPWTRHMRQRDSSVDSSETHVNRDRSASNKENAMAATVGAIEFAPSPQGSSDLDDSATSVEHMDIAQFPTNQLLEMLTGLLYKIVKSNDQLKPFEQDKHDLQNAYVAHVLSFRGKHIPAITLGDYFSRIQKYCPITNDVFLSLLVYFDRIAKRCNAMDPQLFVMDSYNIHRLIIAAVTVGTKFFSDFFYSNSRYARVGGISLQELNRLELQFTILCDFELIVSVQELQRYADLLYKFWNRENRGKVLANSL